MELGVRDGFVSTRCKSGPAHVAGTTLLEPVVVDHTPFFANGQQRCQDPDCGMHTCVYCPGCRKDEGGKGAAGFYCFVAGKAPRNCLFKHHCKRMRTCAEPDDE